MKPEIAELSGQARDTLALVLGTIVIVNLVAWNLVLSPSHPISIIEAALASCGELLVGILALWLSIHAMRSVLHRV
jgi:hypothetical protein